MRETVESTVFTVCHSKLACPALPFYMYDKHSFSHSQKPRRTVVLAQSVYSNSATSPTIFLSLTPQVTSKHPLLRAASIYGQAAANSSTVTLHGVVQGVLLYRWWGAPELGKTHQRAPGFLPVRPKKDRRGSNRDAKRLKWQGGKGLWIHRCKMAGPIGLLVACAFM